MRATLTALALFTFAATAHAQKWEVVATTGLTKWVYIEPAGLKDKNFVAQVLHSIYTQSDPKQPLQVFIFDSKEYTPRGIPMTDKQMLHQRARYNRNPNTGLDEFAWVTVVNPKTSPPDMKETVDSKIRPGFAE